MSENKNSHNFFEILSKITNIWKKEITEANIQPKEELLVVAEAKRLLNKLLDLKPPDNIHKEIIQKTIPIINWIIRDIEISRLLKAIVIATYENKIPQQLSQEEKKKILSVLDILTQEQRKKSKDTTFALDENKIPIERPKEKTYYLSLIKTDIPDFVGTDEHIYRGLTKNTIANLPKKDAKALKKKLKDLIEILNE